MIPLGLGFTVALRQGRPLAMSVRRPRLWDGCLTPLAAVGARCHDGAPRLKIRRYRQRVFFNDRRMHVVHNRTGRLAAPAA